MATLTQIRQDIGTRLRRGVHHLIVYDRIPDAIEVPAAVVGMPDPMEYNLTYGPTGLIVTLPVRLFVSRFDSDEAQGLLDTFIAPTGTTSVKRAIEDSTVTITSTWHAVDVSRVGDFGLYRVGDMDYIGCEFTVEVVAT